jgi:hypothetical protein
MAITLANLSVGSGSSGSITSTTSGNCLIVCAGSLQTAGQASVSGVTIGGSADNFAAAESGHATDSGYYADVFIWADPNCVGGQTALAFQGSNLTTIQGWACYEVSGLAAATPTDQITANGGFSTATWSSGTTPSTTQANEFWVYVAQGYHSPAQAAGWTNSGIVSTFCRSGYQNVSSIGTASASGTITNDAHPWAAAAATFLPAGVLHTATGSLTVTPAFSLAKAEGHVQAMTVVPAFSLLKAEAHKQSLTVTPAFSVTDIKNFGKGGTPDRHHRRSWNPR